MKSAICDFCKKQIKAKRQYYLEVHSCITGTSDYPDGRMEEEKWHDNLDICERCAKELGIIKIKKRKNKLK